MNRREFLIAVGATACSGRAASVEAPDIETPERPATRPPVIVDHDSSALHTNLAASPLAIHGDVLVQQIGDELWLWDLPTMRRIDAFSLQHEAFTLLADGSIATFGPREVEHDCALYRLASGVLSTYPTWLCGAAREPLLLRTGSPNSVYSVRDDEIVRFRFDGSKLEKDATIAIPVASFNNRAQMFSLSDGRIIAPGDGISILEPGKAAVRRPMPKLYPRHLARATAERFWYSRAGHTDNAFDTLVLAHLDAPQLELQTRTLAPSRIVHLASHGSALALLLMSPVGKDDTWHVAVIDEAGTERWRAEVPRQRYRYKLNYGAIALSDTRVVLRTQSDALLAWDAATGAPVAVTAPA